MGQGREIQVRRGGNEAKISCSLIYLTLPSALVNPKPESKFPRLKSQMVHLVRKLKNPIQSPDIERIDYPKLFNDCRIPSHGLIERAMTTIEPEAIGFQGQILSPEL